MTAQEKEPSSGRHKSRSSRRSSSRRSKTVREVDENPPESPKQDSRTSDRKTKERRSSRASKPGAIPENATSNSGSRRDKERSSAKASKPGAIPENDRSIAADRKKDRRSNRASNKPGAVPPDKTTHRDRRKGGRAASSSNQSRASAAKVDDAGTLFETTAVDGNSESQEAVEKVTRMFEQKEKKRQEEFEQQEKKRQQEMEALNQRLEAERAAQREERKKRRKRNLIGVCCCSIALIAAGVGAFFALNKDEATITQIFITQIYNPPSVEECRAITRNETIAGQEADLEPTVLDMAFDVTIDSGCDITTSQVEILLLAIQEKLLPPLAGCPIETASRRGLVADNEQPELAIGENRYVILNAFVKRGIDPDVVCGSTQDDSNLFHRISMNVFLTLKGPVERSDLVLLTFDQVDELLEKGGQVDDDLKDPFGLDDSFSKVRSSY